MCDFLTTGYIIKSFQEQINKSVFSQSYVGIGRYLTWPLEMQKDTESIALTEEAYDRWFCYFDKRLWVIPDIAFILRYAEHCKELGMKTFYLQIDTLSPATTTDTFREGIEIGYDYADADMITSCLNDDMIMTDSYVRQQFQPIAQKLNPYGLFDSLEDIQKYLSIRDLLIKQGYDMEEYYNPTIVRLSKIESSF